MKTKQRCIQAHLLLLIALISFFSHAQTLNSPPSAVGDNISMTQDTVLVLQIAALLSNDSDPDGDPLSILFIDDWINGQANFDQTAGTITFTPDTGFVGDANFTYTLSDGNHVGYEGLDWGFVTIAVGGEPQINYPPVAGNDNASTAENTALELSLASLLSNDSDPNTGDILSITGVSDAINGIVLLDQAAGTISFIPATDFAGSASFNYNLFDGTITSSGLVSINVTHAQTTNSPPSAVGDNISMTQDTVLVLQIAALLSNDSDPDGDPLSILFIDDWINGQANFDQTAGTITFTPDTGFVGDANFTYTLSDGNHVGYEGLDWGVVTITVEGDQTENLPPIAGADAASTTQDTPIDLTVATLLSNDSDPDINHSLSITGVSSALNGNVLFDATTGTITFTPSSGFFGEASFQYTLSDGTDAVNGLVVITVNALFNLTVNSGLGDGLYPEASVVSITADPAPVDQQFLAWTGDVADIADINSANTSLTLLANNTVITATYISSSDDIEPPSAPTGLNLIEVRENSIHLSWNPSTDNVGVSGYVLRMWGDDFTAPTQWTDLTLQEQIQPSSFYLISVVAIDAAGNRSPESEPLAVETLAAGSVDEFKAYIFGHSLISHDYVESDATRETTVPHWMYLLTEETERNFTADGEYGNFFVFIQNLPVEGTQWGFELAPSGWLNSFADSDFDAIIVTEANFIQEYLTSPNDEYIIDGQNTGSTPVSAAIGILDYVRQQEPGVPFYIYENWPEMNLVQPNPVPFPASPAELASYHAYTSGRFHNWWLELQDSIIAARPDADVKMIPVGPIISDLLVDIPALTAIPSTELYEDDAPHGRATIYFLAALIKYMALFQEQPPEDFQMSDSIQPAVRDNYTEIVNYIWNELQNFTDEAGESRVFLEN